MEQEQKATKKYEFVYWINPSIPEENLEKVVSDTGNLVEKLGGKVIEEQDLRKEQFAYEIKRFTEGFLKLSLIELAPEKVEELKRELKLNADILRYSVNCTKNTEKKAKKPGIRPLIKNKAKASIIRNKPDDIFSAPPELKPLKQEEGAPQEAAEEKKEENKEKPEIELQEVDEKLKKILGSEF